MIVGPIVLAAAASAQIPPTDSYAFEPSPAVAAVLADAKGGKKADTVARLEALAAQNDLGAIELLGEIYSGGIMGVERDRARGCRYFSQIATKDALAAHNYATCLYESGSPIRDLALARVFYGLASRGGYRTSHCALGNMLIKGEGGPVDAEEGLALCRRSAELGEAHAQVDLAGYLLVGEVTQRDPVEARRLLEMAAARGHANGLFLLAQVNDKGDGVAENPAAARALYQRAFEAGRADAAWHVARMLAKQGFQKDGTGFRVSASLLREAIAWAGVAAEKDPDPAIRAQALELMPSLKTLIDRAERPDRAGPDQSPSPGSGVK